MKAAVLALAAAMATGVTAGNHNGRRHEHGAFHLQRDVSTAGPACEAITIYTTVTGPAGLWTPPASVASVETSTWTPAPVVTATVAASSPAPVVPTPWATTLPTPGVYTIPATTITLTESTTVCAATSTSVPSGGVWTAGGVTIVVVEATTVVVPYAAVSTSAGVLTSTILSTTYVCPSAGTYTIAPLTTTVVSETVWVYPTAASYPPGTWTQAEVVTTITETDYVVVCPFTSPAPAVAAAAATTAAAAAPAATTKASTSSSSLGSSGSLWAITYTPYNDNGSCKDESSVASDIALIASKGFTSVRVYSTDCSTLQFVGAAVQASGLKLILGIFISDTGISGASEQVTEIVSWGQWELVELVVVGNEAVFNGYSSASELASFISSSRSSFASSGYSGPITTTEPLDIWQSSVGELCAVVDVVGANVHPFFNSDVSSDGAGSFVASQLSIVDGLCSGKSGLNLETGWPSAGYCNGAACPGPSEQATAVAGIQAAAGSKSVMFSFTNDLWKPLGSFDCEQSWGSIDLFPDV